jgi:cytochrome oxidase Cu insertion factor (SCO1/SenC/PrrC family)
LRTSLPLLALALALAFAAAAHETPMPGGDALAFTPPPPGSYRLPPIQRAPEGELRDSHGRRRALADVTRGRTTLLGLVYTRCSDSGGCPRATWAFSEVRALLRADPALERRVRLVTLSFDPVHDVPAVMAAYGARSMAGRRGAEWLFLTAASPAALAPILEGLWQDLSVPAGSADRPGTEAFTHTLKAFLLDSEGRVREIYGTAYLMPAMIVNDIVTLDLERRAHIR